MKWVVIVLGVLAVLVAGVAVAGMMLPQNHTAARTARFSATPDTVWKLVTDFGSYPAWREGVDSVEIVPAASGNPSWREIAGSERMTYVAEVSEAPTHFVARIADKSLPFGGSWDYRIEPDGTGSRLTITENGEVYNPIFRFVSRFIMGHTATIDKYLTDLSARLGETYDPSGR